MIYKENELDKVIDFFLKETEGLNIIGLSGNLGAGKTTFVKALLKSLGVTQNVVSPTFVLRRDYEVDSSQSPTPTLPEGEGEVPLYRTANLKNYDSLKLKAVEMRLAPTKAEEVLWSELKGEKIGHKFRRQQIIESFIVDFICLNGKLIIEVDGEVHDFQVEKDRERQVILESLGYRVLRFKNEQVLKKIDSVISEIKRALVALPNGEGLGGAFNLDITRVIHIDAYRLKKPEQIYQVVSRDELADKNSLVIVEWPELSENIFQKIFLFEHVDEDRRKISIKSV